MIEKIFAAALLLVPSLCWAQGNEATTSSEDTQSGDAVQIGAGSTSAVTTGSSAESGPDDKTVPPLAPAVQIAPPRDSFLGAGMLAIQPPDRLRCDVIADANARKRCTSGDGRNNTRSADD